MLKKLNGRFLKTAWNRKMMYGQGMTLIEVMIVITIIVVLLLIAFLVYRAQIGKARDARRKSDIYKIKTAAEDYEKDHDCYPTTAVLPACGNSWSPYLEKIPCDPETNTNYYYYPDPDHPQCPRWFWIFTDFEYKQDPQIANLGCTYGCGPNFNDFYQTSPNAPEPEKGEGPRQTPGPSCEPGKYGCFNLICRPICTYGGVPECQPNYTQPDCSGFCVEEANECL